MKRTDMGNQRAPKSVRPREPGSLPARAIFVSHRPAVRVRLDSDPLRPQHHQLRRFFIAVGQHLHISIAVEQERRADPFDQLGRDQLRCALIALRAIDRQRSQQPRQQPNRPLPHRVITIDLVELRFIRSRKRLAAGDPEPGRDKRPHRLRSALAPEPPCHKFSFSSEPLPFAGEVGLVRSTSRETGLRPQLAAAIKPP